MVTPAPKNVQPDLHEVVSLDKSLKVLDDPQRGAWMSSALKFILNSSYNA